MNQSTTYTPPSSSSWKQKSFSRKELLASFSYLRVTMGYKMAPFWCSPNNDVYTNDFIDSQASRQNHMHIWWLIARQSHSQIKMLAAEAEIQRQESNFYKTRINFFWLAHENNH